MAKKKKKRGVEVHRNPLVTAHMVLRRQKAGDHGDARKEEDKNRCRQRIRKDELAGDGVLWTWNQKKTSIGRKMRM